MLNNNFIFDNYKRSDYISSTLVALFYTKTNNNLLNKQLKNPLSIYVQKFIKINFIEKLKNGLSINYKVIKDFLKIIINNNYYIKENNIVSFYKYLSNILLINSVEYENRNLIEDIDKNKSFVSIINLDINDNINNIISLKDLIDNWLLNKCNNNLEVKKILNTPELIALKINRNNKCIDININKKICIFNYTRQYDLEKLRWNILSIICHDTKSNNYYSILIIKGKWYLFNDIEIPCFKEISMSNNLITNKIKKECMLLFYKLDK
jgi:hypothetical protein